MKSFEPRAEGRHRIIPLFWQRGDDPAAIREEMRRMKEAGINDFIVEPRPHPDYLGDGWWRDCDLILSEAAKLDMIVWFFDDGTYPSGTANGELAKRYPEHTKRYWAENHMDATGPAPHAHFLVDEWLKPGETLFRLIAARRKDRGDELIADSLVDVTAFSAHGRLYWPVPEGEWRVFVVKVSPYGEEAHTQDYVNPLSREGVSKYIELVHERHYARYQESFGNRVAGFFTDEPRFGNTTGYDRVIGKSRMPLPYVDGLEDMLGGDFARRVPLLWYPSDDSSAADARYAYMDAVSRLFAQNFTGQLGDWCRAHGVKLVGHLVEENGAHARLGYGAGHFFRAMEGLDMAGIDVVCNLLPEQTGGTYLTAFNEYDCDFNHWGLAKMASSAAHLDPKKNGDALCEAFGAYGWFEGLKLMKWITDHLAVQGVGIVTPHAFSPAPYPDPDCPPHFYARGKNPQFRHFRAWADYANRLGDALAGAIHVAPVAVVYHAEAEWGGASEPFEKAVKALAQAQIDCDVVPADALLSGAAAEDGTLSVGRETFRALVVPYMENIPAAFADRLNEIAAAGVPVLFTRALPARCYFGAPMKLTSVEAVSLAELPGRVRALGAFDIACDPPAPDLLYSHNRKDGIDFYLFVNQSTRHEIDARVTFRDERRAVLYDAMTGKTYAAEQEGNAVHLRLEAWETLFVAFGSEAELLEKRPDARAYARGTVLADGWTISTATADEYPAFTKTAFTELGDLSRPDRLPDFSGTVRYERRFALEKPEDILVEITEAYEAVRIAVNGARVAELICPPYRAYVPAALLRAGGNELSIEVTNTLVKEQHQNPFDPYFMQEPTGIVGSVTIATK